MFEGVIGLGFLDFDMVQKSYTYIVFLKIWDKNIRILFSVIFNIRIFLSVLNVKKYTYIFGRQL